MLPLSMLVGQCAVHVHVIGNYLMHKNTLEAILLTSNDRNIISCSQFFICVIRAGLHMAMISLIDVGDLRRACPL